MNVDDVEKLLERIEGKQDKVKILIDALRMKTKCARERADIRAELFAAFYEEIVRWVAVKNITSEDVLSVFRSIEAMIKGKMFGCDIVNFKWNQPNSSEAYDER
jgi:hypothetical protein